MKIMDSYLILIRHAQPDINPNIAASDWHLSPQGKLDSQLLADKLRSFNLDCIYHSLEPKALETAIVVTEKLNLPCIPWQDLHEHERQGVIFTTQADFEKKVEALFSHPAEVVFGCESADQAFARFDRAAARVIQHSKDRQFGSVGIASHGTVISLFVARYCQMDEFKLWKQLSMPSALVLSLPDFTFEAYIDLKKP